jgi:hypothetical protein
MNILIACEFSGIVREFFRNKGHNVLSCDLKDTLFTGNHYKGDVLDVINDGWDMMIAFPPCTYLSHAGNRWYNSPGRHINRMKAFDFFLQLYYARIPRVCIVNPVGVVNKWFRKPDQIIHPYFFGEGKLKQTCIWLRGIPVLWLTHTDFSESDLFNHKRPLPSSIDNTPRQKKRYWCDHQSSKSNCRSLSFFSFASAMADQWS